jgi:hypothetical protein
MTKRTTKSPAEAETGAAKTRRRAASGTNAKTATVRRAGAAPKGGDAIDPDRRHQMIREVAYRHYTERGYEDGHDLDDWLRAETEVDRVLPERPRR